MNQEITETLLKADCEGTRSPYWLILDPRKNMSLDVNYLANDITGPFFSREDAESFLSATRYNFSKRAVVYCLSGCYSQKYDRFVREIKK